MGVTYNKSTLDDNKIYLYGILICLSILFTIGDIVASSTQKLVLSSVLSTITLLIVFVGRYQTRAIEVSAGVDKTVDFIRSNFSKSSVILGILDVICSVIAVFSGVFIIALISRCTLALRIFIYINKYKTVAIAIWVFVFVYLFKRREKKNKGVLTMAEIEQVKTTKVSMPQWVTILVAVLGVVYAVAATIFPSIAIYGDSLISALTGLGITSVTTVVGVFTKAKDLTQDEINKLVEKKTATEAKSAEKQLAKDEKKATALVNKLAAQQAKANAAAEKQAYLLQLASDMKARKEAEEQAKLAEEQAKLEAANAVVEDKPTEDVTADKVAE